MVDMDNTFRLLNLQAQDKIVRHEPSAYNNKPAEEHVYYVASVDYVDEIVHALSFSGNDYRIRFDEISDIIKAEHPIMVSVPESTWTAHRCDPAWLNLPVRAQAFSVYKGSITGVVVPKWPGQNKGVLHLDARAGSACLPGVTEADLVASLPASGCNPKRFNDGAASRNKDYRVAGNRVRKFFTAVTAGAGSVRTPLDPSLGKHKSA